MRKRKQVLLTAVCAVLLVATSILGTIAYLTSQATVTNTFTIGNVEIKLEETDVDEDGNVLDEDGNILEKDDEGNYIGTPNRTEEGNEYHLIPGKTYLKDPKMTVLKGSEESYIRMILTIHNKTDVETIINNHKLTDYSALIGGWDSEKWIYHDYTVDETEDTISFEFRYYTTVEGVVVDDEEKEIEQNVVLEPLFTELIVPGEITNEELEALYDDDFKMVVEGHAIQKAGFEADTENNKTAEDVAWEAFDQQVNK